MWKPIAYLSIAAVIILICNQSFVSRKHLQVHHLAPPKDLVHLTLGYREVISDSLWLRVIQDYDICGVDPNEKSINDLRTKSMEVPICKKGWTFQMLDAITELTPKNRLPYATGATVLSVLVNDPEGAAQIFEKSLRYFENDWSIQYRAGYHYLWELNDEAKAAEKFALAGKNGAPAWVNLLGARLATKHGKAMIAKAMLEEYKQLDPNAENNPRFTMLLKKAEAGLTGGQDQDKELEERTPSSSGEQSPGSTGEQNPRSTQ